MKPLIWKSPNMTPAELAKSNTEHGHQRAFFAWCNMAERYGLIVANDPVSYTTQNNRIARPIPQLKWIHAIHNQGHGDAIRGGKARAEGVKAGVADIFLPWPMLYIHSYHSKYGLYIEMKRFGGKSSTVQNEFIKDMIARGYACYVCEGWEAARDTVIAYLGLTAPADAL